MSILKGMNPVRFFLILSVLGSCFLGWRGWTEQQKLADARESLEFRIDGLVGNIELLAQKHTKLSKDFRKEGLVGQNDPESYIRKIAAGEYVELGDLKITPTQDTRVRGVVDKKYRIRSNDRERSFNRSRISNFLYKLEADSRRIKVTDVKIEMANKRTKPHEIPDDLWTFEAEITSRQATE